jgi:hypothetical protein
MNDIIGLKKSTRKGDTIISPRLMGKVFVLIEKACRPEAPDAIEDARRRFPFINRGGVAFSVREFDLQWRESNLQRAIDELRKCAKTKNPTYRSYSLKCAIEHACGEYISNGDLVVAALYLNFRVCQPHEYARRDNPNVYIGVSMRDVSRLKHEADARRALDRELDEWERRHLSTSEASHRSMERTLRGYPDAPIMLDEGSQIMTPEIVKALQRQIQIAA